MDYDGRIWERRRVFDDVQFFSDSYVGVWNVGWPLPWYSFNAKMIADTHEGPYFALII